MLIIAYKGNLELVKELVNHRDVNNQDYNGNTPLHDSIKSGHTEVVKFLLSLDNIIIDVPSKNLHTGMNCEFLYNYIIEYIFTDIKRIMRPAKKTIWK